MPPRTPPRKHDIENSPICHSPSYMRRQSIMEGYSPSTPQRKSALLLNNASPIVSSPLTEITNKYIAGSPLPKKVQSPSLQSTGTPTKPHIPTLPIGEFATKFATPRTPIHKRTLAIVNENQLGFSPVTSDHSNGETKTPTSAGRALSTPGSDKKSLNSIVKDYKKSRLYLEGKITKPPSVNKHEKSFNIKRVFSSNSIQRVLSPRVHRLQQNQSHEVMSPGRFLMQRSPSVHRILSSVIHGSGRKKLGRRTKSTRKGHNMSMIDTDTMATSTCTDFDCVSEIEDFDDEDDDLMSHVSALTDREIFGEYASSDDENDDDHGFDFDLSKLDDHDQEILNQKDHQWYEDEMSFCQDNHFASPYTPRSKRSHREFRDIVSSAKKQQRAGNSSGILSALHNAVQRTKKQDISKRREEIERIHNSPTSFHEYVETVHDGSIADAILKDFFLDEESDVEPQHQQQ